MKLPIYMDNHATTPVDPRVLDTMMPYFTDIFGNPASRNHRFGWQAEAAVEEARAQIADAIGAEPQEIVFTSGATEANNLAIKGVAHMYGHRGKHIVTCVTEHRAVIDPCRRLEKEGFSVTFLPVDEDGLVDLEQLRDSITDATFLITIMHANNEIGVIQDVAAVGRIAREKEVLFHTDATQSVGKIPLDVEPMQIDLLSLSAHKVYGPKGVGALYVRRRNPRVRLAPLLDGGGHERGMRSGTLNVPSIIGLGAAVALARQQMDMEAIRLTSLRDRLVSGMTSRLSEVYLNGHPERRLPGNANLSFACVDGEALLMALQNDVAVSSGSACTSADPEPSYVLRALGIGDDLAHTSLRFGLGRFNTAEEVDYTIDRVEEAVHRLREMSAVWTQPPARPSLSPA